MNIHEQITKIEEEISDLEKVFDSMPQEEMENRWAELWKSYNNLNETRDILLNSLLTKEKIIAKKKRYQELDVLLQYHREEYSKIKNPTSEEVNDFFAKITPIRREYEALEWELMSKKDKYQYRLAMFSRLYGINPEIILRDDKT